MKNNIIQVLKLIRKDLVKSILVLFQITIVLLFTYSIFTNTMEFNEKNDKYKMLWLNKNIFNISYQGDVMGISKSPIEEKKIIDLKEYLNGLNLECVSFDGGQIFIDNFEGIEDVKYYNKLLEGEPILSNKSKSLVEYISVSSNFIKEFNLKLDEGRWFNDNEYKNNTLANENTNEFIPAVLGERYKKYFKINNIVNNKDGFKFKVIGFLKKNQYFSSSNLFFFPSKISSLDTFIITPYNTPKFSKNHDTFDSVWKLQNNQDYDQVISKVDTKIKDLNLNAKIEEHQKYINLYKDNYNQIKNSLLIQQALLTIIIISGITVTLMLFINKHKQSFTIHIAYGATYASIIIRMLLVPIFIFIVSIPIAICLIRFNAIGYLIGLELVNNMKAVNSYAFILSVSLTLVIILISTILPIYKIKSESITIMMKEE